MVRKDVSREPQGACGRLLRRRRKRIVTDVYILEHLFQGALQTSLRLDPSNLTMRNGTSMQMENLGVFATKIT